MDVQRHWEAVYRTRSAREVSWFAPHLTTSLTLIHRTGVEKSAGVIDVGGGASTLVDDLIDEGFHDLTVLDVSGPALDISRQRLADRADAVTWVQGDVTRVPLPEARFHLWHDRAVFHFLTDALERAQYVEQVRHAVAPGGHVIVATSARQGRTSVRGSPSRATARRHCTASSGEAFPWSRRARSSI